MEDQEAVKLLIESIIEGDTMLEDLAEKLNFMYDRLDAYRKIMCAKESCLFMCDNAMHCHDEKHHSKMIEGQRYCLEPMSKVLEIKKETIDI
jgi:hypothetical protein